MAHWQREKENKFIKEGKEPYEYAARPDPIINGLFEDSPEKRTNPSSHIYHPWEDDDLTFQEIEELLDELQNGTLNSVEKIDGIQCYISYEDEAKVARTENEAKQGGYSSDNISEKGIDNEKFEELLKDVLDAVEEFCKRVGNEEEIFKNGNIFFNCEVIDEEFNNVIEYDDNYICFHHNGHVVTDDLDDFGDSDERLSYVLDKLKNAEGFSNFKFIRTPKADLSECVSKKFIKEKKKELKELREKEGLSEQGTVVGFAKHRIEKELDRDIDHQDLLIELRDYLAGEKNLNETDENVRNRVQELAQSYKKRKIKKRATKPLKEIFLDIGKEILNNLSSEVIDDEDTCIKCIRKKVSDAVDKIRNYDGKGSTEAEEILIKQLRQLGHTDNINSAVEGIVFQFNDKIYKLTGLFAPINKIIGLVKHGRGKKLPAIGEQLTEDNIPQVTQKSGVIAVIPGSFKPPHAGHWRLAQWAADKKYPGGRFIFNKVKILISNKPRAGHSANNRISVGPKDSKGMWNLFIDSWHREGEDATDIEADVVEETSPIHAACEFGTQLDGGAMMAVVKSEKDSDDNRFNQIEQYVQKHAPEVKVTTVEAPIMKTGISATQMREWLVEGNAEKFKNFLPDHLSMNERNMAWNMLTGNREAEKGRETPQRTKPPENIPSDLHPWDTYGESQNKEEDDDDGDSSEKPPPFLSFDHGGWMIYESMEELVENESKQRFKNIVQMIGKAKEKIQKLKKNSNWRKDKDVKEQIEHLRDQIETWKVDLAQIKRNQEIDLEEISSMGGGAVAGAPAKKPEEDLEEAILRKLKEELVDG